MLLSSEMSTARTRSSSDAVSFLPPFCCLPARLLRPVLQGHGTRDHSENQHSPRASFRIDYTHTQSVSTLRRMGSRPRCRCRRLRPHQRIIPPEENVDPTPSHVLAYSCSLAFYGAACMAKKHNGAN